MAAPRSHIVVIENMQFNPQNLAVRLGDKVIWKNQDLFPHTVSAVDNSFDSKSIDASGSWSYVAGRTGDFAYACSFHPTMKGSLKVQK